MTKSLFQTVFLIIFGVAVVIAVLIFAGILPGFRAKPVGQAGALSVWGVFADNKISPTLSALAKKNQDKFSLTYTKPGDDFDSALVNALASGQGPDVIIAPHELLLKHRDKFVVLPFASLPLRSYQDTFVDEGSLFVNQNGFFALPLALDPLLFYYNKDLYTNAGLLKAPSNWEEFIKIESTLTKLGERNRLTQSAFALGTFGNNNNAKDILSLLILQAGGTPVEANNGQPIVMLDKDFGFTLKPAEAALSFFGQFADPAKSTYCWNNSLPEARDSFLSEELAGYFGFASEASYLREKNPHLNFNLSTVPQMTRPAGGPAGNQMTFGRLYGVAVLKSSSKSGAAWQMVFALTGSEYAKQAVSAIGLAPARRDLLAVPDPAKPDEAVTFDSAIKSRGWFDFAPAENKNIFQTMNDNIATGRQTPAQAVTEANGKISVLLNPNP